MLKTMMVMQGNTANMNTPNMNTPILAQTIRNCGEVSHESKRNNI